MIIMIIYSSRWQSQAWWGASRRSWRLLSPWRHHQAVTSLWPAGSTTGAVSAGGRRTARWALKIFKITKIKYFYLLWLGNTYPDRDLFMNWCKLLPFWGFTDSGRKWDFFLSFDANLMGYSWNLHTFSKMEKDSFTWFIIDPQCILGLLNYFLLIIRNIFAAGGSVPRQVLRGRAGRGWLQPHRPRRGHQAGRRRVAVPGHRHQLQQSGRPRQLRSVLEYTGTLVYEYMSTWVYEYMSLWV